MHKLFFRALGISLTLSLGGPVQARPQHPKWPPKSYAIYYGQWDDETIRKAHEFDCIFFHPGANFGNLSPEQLKKLKAGKDGLPGTADDVIAIGYVSIGEDEKVPAGPPTLKQDVAGPTIEVSPGKWLPSHKGYPAKYLDEQSYVFDAQGNRQFGENGKPLTKKGHDGIPDENGVWGSYYAFAGDPGWHGEVLARMKRLQDEGADGFFLDTVDTASPWGSYGGTQAPMARLLQVIREHYPKQLVVANRGMFLLDKFAPQFSSSIDGMLYESLYTIWDWQKSQGIQSPWCLGDFDVYKNQVLPNARKSGFHLFFINYLNPQQSDFHALATSAHELVAASQASEYLADPLLAKLYAPFSVLIPSQSADKPPVAGALKVQELTPGRFGMQFELAGLGERVLGKDYFLDLRYGDHEAPAGQVGLLPAVPFDYSGLSVENGLVKLESYGLEKGITGHFYVRGVGKSRNLDTPFLHVSLATAKHDRPGGVQELQAGGLEQSVRLTWKSKGPHSFRVYQGESPGTLKPGPVVNRLEARITGLRNGQIYYFAVAGLTADGKEGVLSRPVVGHAEDCTPPPSPSQITAQPEPHQVTIRWAGKGDAKTFKVYCVPEGEKYRIPLRLGSDVSICTFKDVVPGKYWVAVTAVDDSGNESKMAQKVQVVVP